jgi:hypothetical protein
MQISYVIPKNKHMNVVKTLAAAVALTLIAGYGAAQNSFFGGIKGNGQIAKRVFKVAEFSAVSVSSGIDLYLEPTGKNELVAVTDKNVLDVIEVEQNGDRVTIKLKEGVRKTTNGIKVYVSYKKLHELSASGGSDVYMKDDATLKSDKLSLEGSGGSDLRLRLDVGSLAGDFSGGSDAYLSGRARTANIDISGGSDLKAKDLDTEVCSISASGGSDAVITATKEIKVDASGASDVSYYGSPSKTSVSKSGGSDIYRK